MTVAGPRLQTSGEPQSCTQITEAAMAAEADVDTALCGGLYKCRFSPAGDTDLFNWTVPAGTVGWLKIAGPSTYGSQWCLYNPSGALVECQANLDTTPKLIAGTHRILTRDTYNYTGDYYLSVQGISSAHRCSQPIACGDIRRGTFATKGDTDTFAFTTSAARSIDLKITGPSTYGSKWCVFNASGDAVGACTSGEGTLSLPSAGTYTIGVNESYNYTGAYVLSLQCL
ncbi:MAG: PPC domain-containing protein [Rhodospirillales bacterium]